MRSFNEKEFAKSLIYYKFIYDHTNIDNVDCIKKDSEFSQSLRKKGNEMYGKRNYDNEYEEVHEYYSRSIAFAPIDSDDLALAYGNRSALLHRIGKHEESILDIDRALEINKSDIAVIVKLLCRKVECLAALGSSESQKVYDKVKYLLPEILQRNQNEKSTLENMRKAEIALQNLCQVPNVKNKETEEHMFVLQKKELQNSFDSVALQFDEKLDKHLIATRDIKPGEIIFVEKPYIGCLNTNKGHIYCGHCFTKTWASIPCDFCHWCMFCSKKCKEVAWKNYHVAECSVISYLIDIKGTVTYSQQLSLRILMTEVIKSGNLFKFIKAVESADNHTDKLLQKNACISNEFKRFYSFCDKAFERVLRKYVDEVFYILSILCKYTNFFGEHMNYINIVDLRHYEEVLSIGAVLLKLCSRTNFHFTDLHDSNPTGRCSNGCINCTGLHCSKGASVHSLSFLVNYSCYPNVKKCITEDYKAIIFSLLPIKKNTPLLMAYQQPFFKVDKSRRQNYLFHDLSYSCDCEACKFDWPTIQELWKMPKDNPKLYMKYYNKLESDLYNKFDKLVRPILIDCQKAQYNQATVKKLSNAIEQAALCLQQPSVVICELMICLQLTFQKLYLKS
ncbi:SET and MYND domain-containing protein 4-like [Phymastichus coffea]|uniref:SET and MYND domain-containing protein 4-like n=1 Tax=Phymastichus coffea TaxID=108790 RepID=UPI00273C882E|nr:SET and MYND domain-containing protein 4-like [Phymastichus coffea]XP_058796513.1 SET and MYND domain-containing protein 4-like [Phymastichus coffea]XP_058796514.1 SET and MYND domain-containing protein 4-like [Phymastichus coffea]